MTQWIKHSHRKNTSVKKRVKFFFKKTKIMNLTNADESEFITVLLSRGVDRGGY